MRARPLTIQTGHCVHSDDDDKLAFIVADRMIILDRAVKETRLPLIFIFFSTASIGLLDCCRVNAVDDPLDFVHSKFHRVDKQSAS